MAARIGITMGDPAGIGPEIVAAALANEPALARRSIVYGSAKLLAAAADRMGVTLAPSQAIVDLPAEGCIAGAPNQASAVAQVAWLEAAAAAALRGDVAGLATAPISKTWAARAGLAFPGHTEFLQARFAAPTVAMSFLGLKLRVVLATTHLPLREVATSLTSDRIVAVARLLHSVLTRALAHAAPRLGVVGLNPHAGEGGALGNEERSIVAPAIARLRGDGLAVEGPLVPDVAFRQHLEGRYDGLVAMYHDQALIPLKLVEFDDAVNTTLGLPIVRTSPDHGTAYDIAGTGQARFASMRRALALAAALIDGAPAVGG